MRSLWLMGPALLALTGCTEPDALRAPLAHPDMEPAGQGGSPVPIFATEDAAKPDATYAAPDPAAPEGDQPARTPPAR